MDKKNIDIRVKSWMVICYYVSPDTLFESNLKVEWKITFSRNILFPFTTSFVQKIDTEWLCQET